MLLAPLVAGAVLVASNERGGVMPSPRRSTPGPREGDGDGGPRRIRGSCTIFATSSGSTSLFANNEDWKASGTFYWVRLPVEGGYGGIYFGHRTEEELSSKGTHGIEAQGGVNEKGLAFDYASLPDASLTEQAGLPERGDIMMTIQGSCATVQDAIAVARRHNWGPTLGWQVLVADATGDAVVIGPGRNGRLAFTRKPPGDGYLLATNFNVANPQHAFDGNYPCRRYDTAAALLATIKAEGSLTPERLRSALKATHIEGPERNTEYSYVIDLASGTIYLNHWHQFGETATLRLAEEIAKATPRRASATPAAIPISALFSAATVRQAAEEHQRHRSERAGRRWR
jgi:hypothetical protein